MEATNTTNPENITIDTIAQHLNDLLSKSVSEFQNLISQANIFEALNLISDTCKKAQDCIWQTVLTWLLSDTDFLKRLRIVGATKGLRFVRYSPINITLPTGSKIKVKSPFFVKAKPKRGKKKRGPQNRGSHLALELLGFVNKVFSDLAYHAVQLALLAPSFEVASRILKSEGANISVNKIRGLVEALFPSKLSKRVELPLEKDGESLKDCRVLLEPDGGRLRQRKTKKGRIPKGKKRSGYHTDWIEPKLFIIHVLDKNGRPIKQIPPVIDGTTGKLPDFIKLLKEYLVQLKINEAKEVILAGDGASWIWDRIPKLLEEVGVSKNKIAQILDWTHAKQNLYEAFDKLPKKKKAKKKVDIQYFKDLLFSGRINKMVSEVKKIFNVNSASRIIKKFKSYFIPNSSRMQYKDFEHRKMPIGSGAIESAIRRVLNLRLKSPGSFWKLGFAEAMIYLRAQLLSGRWENLKINRVISLHQNFALLAMNYINK